MISCQPKNIPSIFENACKSFKQKRLNFKTRSFGARSNLIRKCNAMSKLSFIPQPPSYTQNSIMESQESFFCLLFFHPQPFGKAVSISHPKISCNKILSAFNLLFNGMKKLIKQLNFYLFLMKEIYCIGSMARSGFVVLFYCRRSFKIIQQKHMLRLQTSFKSEIQSSLLIPGTSNSRIS